MAYSLLADAVLVLHVAVVVFVVGGMLAVLVGNGRGWRWVNLALALWAWWRFPPAWRAARGPSS